MMLTVEQANERSKRETKISKYKDKIKVIFKQVCNAVEESCDKGFYFTDVSLTRLLLRGDENFPLDEYQDLIAIALIEIFLNKGYYAEAFTFSNGNMILRICWSVESLSAWNWVKNVIIEASKENETLKNI